MKCRLFFSAILSALLLAGCTKPAPKPAETETSSAAAETVTAPIVTTAETEVSSASETAAESETAEETTVAPDDENAEKIWSFLSTYESTYTTDLYFLFDFNGDDFPEVAYIGWDMDTPYMNVYDLSGDEPVFLGGTTQGLSPFSDDEQCIGLYRNENTGGYFYHSLSYYIRPNNRFSGSGSDYYCFNRYIIPVDFENHSVEFTFEETEHKNFSSEADAEKYKERVWKELEQCTLVTELKTSYMVKPRDDEKAFREMLAALPELNCVAK